MVKEVLLNLKNLIIDKQLFKSVKIGLEDGISAKDTPFCRLLIEEETVNQENGDLEVNLIILIGTLRLKSIEETYLKHLDIKDNLISTLDLYAKNNYEVSYQGSLTDQDDVENFKITALHFKITIKAVLW